MLGAFSDGRGASEQVLVSVPMERPPGSSNLQRIGLNFIDTFIIRAFTYDHRLRRTGHPVRSAIHKPQIGRSVVGWVTTSESLLLYVNHRFAFFVVCLSFLQFCLGR